MKFAKRWNSCLRRRKRWEASMNSWNKRVFRQGEWKHRWKKLAHKLTLLLVRITRLLKSINSLARIWRFANAILKMLVGSINLLNHRYRIWKIPLLKQFLSYRGLWITPTIQWIIVVASLQLLSEWLHSTVETLIGERVDDHITSLYNCCSLEYKNKVIISSKCDFPWKLWYESMKV